MSNVIKAGKQALTSAVVATTVLWSMGLAAIVPASAATLVSGDLIKASGAAVYYYGSDGKRYVFPNEKTFKTWYADFSKVKVITDSELAAISIGGNVTYRPGTRLIKITTDPKVYAVEPGGKLRHLGGEQIAKDLYGNNWNMWIDDVSDAFFTNYTSGSAVATSTPTAGSLIKTASSADIYYVDGANKRRIADFNAFTANNFRSEFILTVADSIANGLPTGTNITGMESSIAMFQTASAPAPIAGTLTVGLAANNPASSTLVAGQATAYLTALTFGNTTSTERKITSLKLRRLGVSADTTASAIYLYDGANRLTDSASVSTGVATFNDPNGLFAIAPNSSRTIWVVSNIATGTSGQTIGFGITANTDITTNVSGDMFTGTFPVNGNAHSIANADLATVDFGTTTTPATASIDPQNEYTMFQNTVSIGTRKVWLKSIRFRMIGSVNVADLKNFRLLVDGAQVGATITDLPSTGYLTFDFTSAPKTLDTGSRVFKLMGDVVGGSSRDFKWQIREASDIQATDSEFNANVLARVQGPTAFSSRETGVQTIQAGSLTLSKSSDSPSGDVVDQGTGVAIAKYDLKAAGENIKVETLGVTIDTNNDGSTAASQIGSLRNGALFANGVQVGSTQTISATGTTTFNLGSSLIVIPGTPTVLEIRADIFDNDGTNNIVSGSTTVTGKLVTGASNALRQTSGGSVNAPATDTSGNTLTVKAGSMTVAKDQAYGNQSVVFPRSNFLIGKYSVTAGSSEGINLNTISVGLTFPTATSITTASVTNLYVKYGTKTSTVRSTTAASNSFSINEPIAKSGTMAIEVYADLASPFTSGDQVRTSLQLSGTTQNSGTSVTAPAAAIDGQTITTSTSGNLTVSLDSSTPVAAQVIGGSTQDNGALRFKVTAANENLFVKELTFRNSDNANDNALASLAVFSSTSSTGPWTANGSAQAFVADSTTPGYVTVTLSGTDRISVVKDATVYVLVKPTYVSSQSTTVSNLLPRLVLADLKAEGQSTISANGTGGNLVNASGIIVQANSSSTYVDSTEDTATTAVASATTQTVTTGNTIVFLAGDVIFIDENADATWDPATEELMTVLADGGAALTVQRGVFGTTAQTAYTVGKNIYRLSTATMTTNAGIVGNAMTVLNSKLALTVSGTTPSGSQTGGSDKDILVFNASALANASDPANNNVTLNYFDITVSKSTGSTVSNVRLYPTANRLNASFVTTCGALSTTKWRCSVTSTNGVNDLTEGSNKDFSVVADTAFAANGTIEASINSLGSSSAAGVVTSGDVSWTDNAGTTKLWVDQALSTIKGSSPLSNTSASANGVVDTTAPTIAAIVVATGVTADAVDPTDTIAITFSEAIDPTSINSSLVPGGSVVGVAAASTGGFKMAAATAIVTITGITTFDAGTSITEAIAHTVNLALNSSATTLTITLGAITTGTGSHVITGPAMAAGTQVATTVKDANGNAAAAVASATPTGSF